MPSRNLVYDAMILKTRETPSGDRIAVLMTAEAGIVEAFVFGGPKSKLRSLASPYGAGRAFVYLDPTRDYRKLSDFEALEPFSGLRDSLKKLMCAGLVAELLMKTSGGGGDYPAVLDLAKECLRALENLPEEEADYPLVLFLWRLVELLGLMPEPDSCVHCGRELLEGRPLRYSHYDSGFLCPQCSGESGCADSGAASGQAEELSAGAVRWLDRARRLSFPDAIKARLDGASLAGLKSLAFGLAGRAAEGRLSVLKAGAGIL